MVDGGCGERSLSRSVEWRVSLDQQSQQHLALVFLRPFLGILGSRDGGGGSPSMSGTLGGVESGAFQV